RGSLVDFIAARGQRPDAAHAHGILVFHEKHARRAGKVAVFLLRGRGLRLGAASRLAVFITRIGDEARQEDAEDGSLADLRIAEDIAARLLDDAIDHRQAEPGPLADFLGREERLEYLLLRFQ